MELKPGTKLRSVACDTQVVVLSAGSGAALACGGHPMVALDDPAAGAELDAAFDGGSVLGKKYQDDDSGVQVLCVKPGAGTLAVDGRALVQAAAKKLPSSD